ncbi:MAG: undecaprenyl-diphosphatase UppP [Dehalococcoidia bacterium]|nr:undecaprenyl-diphosphatase UppP [Dehalococcoidia bacterium]
MGPVDAIVLGLVQGATEFFPISSSAHLVIVPWLMGWQDPGLTFDVGLHLGTLLAVAAYFWRFWIRIIGAWVSALARGTPFEQGDARLGWFIIIGTIPGGVAGILLESEAEATLRDIRLVAIMLIALGLVLLLAERLARHERDLGRLSLTDSILVGLAQAFAVIPGVSRSGSTISMGLFRGLTRETAARFSFLLSTPIILGASVRRLPSLFDLGMPADERMLLLLGSSASALAGFATIAILLRYLQRHSTLPFVVYRLTLGLSLLVLAYSRGLLR